MDIRQSPAHAKYLEDLGWSTDCVLGHKTKKKIQLFLLKIPVINWHFAKLQRYDETPDEKSIRELFRKKKVFAFSFEPGNLDKDEREYHLALMKRLGGKIDPSVFVPSCTMILDLKKPLNEIRKDFDSNARRLTREHIHSNIETVIQPSTEWPEGTIRTFWEYGKKNNKHWNMTWNIFRKLVINYERNAHFAITKEKSSQQWISGILLLSTTDMLNYFQAWAGPNARKNGSHFWTLYKSLEYGKKIGLSTFDFEGMFDPRFPRKSWKGFSQFKTKFGGKVIQFPGCFTSTNFLGPFTW